MAKPVDRDREEDEVRNSRRAGLRPDERDPDDPHGPPGSAGGEENMSGTPGGGMAAGGLAGANAPSGGVDDEVDALSDAFGDGTQDVPGLEENGGGPPYGGPSGGAVGGTPAEKRAKGGRIPPGQGIVPRGEHRGDSTVGSDPDRKPEPGGQSSQQGGSRAAHRGGLPAGSTDTSEQ